MQSFRAPDSHRTKVNARVRAGLASNGVKVPFVDLKRQTEGLRRELDAALGRVLDSGQFILGPEVEGLEREVAAIVGTTQAIGVSSGTDAIVLALRACGVGPGDRVVISPFSFFATAAAILATGARPVFVDIDRESFNLDLDRLEDSLSGPDSGKIRAILPVHLFGQMADIRAIRALADSRGIPLMEDACQAIGAKRDGVFAGAAGRAGAFSFFPTKNLGAFGDGGIVTTDDPKLAETVRAMRRQGATLKNLHTFVGMNGRLDAIQAAVLRVKLRHLNRWNDARREHAARYTQAFSALEYLGCPVEPTSSRHVYHHYTLRVRGGHRDRLRSHLRSLGIGTEVYYPTPIHLQPALADLGLREGAFPNAEACASEVLSLPVFPELTSAERDAVIDAVLAFKA